MAHFVGLDVSVEGTSVCVVDDVGKAPCARRIAAGAMLLSLAGVAWMA